MSTLRDYLKLKKRVGQFERTANKAAGVLEQIMKQFKSDFNCSTLKDAEKKMRLLKGQRQEAKIAFVKEKERFEKKYGIDTD